ncbi:hypothetical protein EWF20_10525 [Sulfolobus sp. S-194]|nr:hypothetical protein EWF20_10525 [Sulfolobus sp. S-194]
MPKKDKEVTEDLDDVTSWYSYLYKVRYTKRVCRYYVFHYIHLYMHESLYLYRSSLLKDYKNSSISV